MTVSIELNDQMKVRREKMEELREKGISPFGKKFIPRQIQESYIKISTQTVKKIWKQKL